MVAVFKTNVSTKTKASWLQEKLKRIYPEAIISFDLDDCDKILRVENKAIDAQKIVRLLQSHNCFCAELPIVL